MMIGDNHSKIGNIYVKFKFILFLKLSLGKSYCQGGSMVDVLEVSQSSKDYPNTNQTSTQVEIIRFCALQLFWSVKNFPSQPGEALCLEFA